MGRDGVLCCDDLFDYWCYVFVYTFEFVGGVEGHCTDWRKMRSVIGHGHGKPYWARGTGGRQRLVGEDSLEVL